MLATEKTCQELVVKRDLGKPKSALQKAAARITIISVLSRQVNTRSQTSVRDERLPINQGSEFKKASCFLETPTISGKPVFSTMSCTTDGHLASVREGSSESIEDKSCEMKSHNGLNGDVFEEIQGDKSGHPGTRYSSKGSKVLHRQDKVSDPFDYMKERKLSEPVMSPRKRTSSVVSPKLTRCRSTLDIRKNEKPMVLKELGGYKYFAKAGDQNEAAPAKQNTSNANRPAENENTNIDEVSALKQTVSDQKENIRNREKHLLHLEKRLALMEQENSKNKKQISSFREKLKDCSSTIDFLRREKEVLASERDRLSFTLLTSEDELKELRAQNINLVTEYENAEHSRKIAVGHLQESQRICIESHVKRPDPTAKRKADMCKKNDEKKRTEVAEKLSSMTETVQKLRLDRNTLQSEHIKVSSFFAENLKIIAEQMRNIESKWNQSPMKSCKEEVPSEKVISTRGEEVATCNEDLVTPTEDVNELDDFKMKLKSNEHRIDELANEIRDLENRKKGLLESRFAMIQEFQASREVPEDWQTYISGNDGEDKVEIDAPGGDQKRSRATRKIRKLERTLSMDHGVGKLDCIQKLCRKLEDCEQRIHELEGTNSELRAEHEDMEEEAKYLKYVLSYRCDVMKAQVQSEFEKKMAALKDELAKCKSFERSSSDVAALTARNQSLEDEVRRLHEELNTLLQNFPALQVDCQHSSSTINEFETENSMVDVSTDGVDISSNLENSENISENSQNISEDSNGVSESIGEYRPNADQNVFFPENLENSQNDHSCNVANDSENVKGDAIRSLEEKVTQLMEDKRVLLLSMQTLTSQWASRRESSAENGNARGNVETNSRELEQEKARLSETLERMRNVLEEGQQESNNNIELLQEKMLKLKREIQRLDDNVEAREFESLSSEENLPMIVVTSCCTRHEERISELEMEIYRMHEEKKSLLSSIVRLQTDPNFTLSDDVIDCSDVNGGSVVLDNDEVVANGDFSDVNDYGVCSGDVKNHDDSSNEHFSDGVVDSDFVNQYLIQETKIASSDAAVNVKDSEGTLVDKEGVKNTHVLLTKTTSRGDEVQVNMSREDVNGLLGNLQRDLDILRAALEQGGGMPGSSKEEEDSKVHGASACLRQTSVQEVAQLSEELTNLGSHTHALQERLHESESIRCDLHRTISIATDMASEERQKCEELTRTKAALEKEMLKMAKENRDLREGLETLSRARKRRTTRACRASHSSDIHDDDDCHVMYLPRAKAQNFSESEVSDMESPVVESRGFSRNV